jgi:plastocyanin
MLRRISLILVLGACGGGDDPPAIDAPPGGNIDAPAGTIMMVACGDEVATIESTGGFRFAPSTATINVGDVIKFDNGPSHSIVPATGGDNGFRVGFGASTCLQFTAAGSFAFRCNPHTQMTGTITVN